MSFAYAPEFAFIREQRECSSFFGNAILSAAPLENVRIVPLPTLMIGPKNAFGELRQEPAGSDNAAA